MFQSHVEPQGIETHASDALPELILTLPTPEIRSSAEFSCWQPEIGYAQTSEVRTRSIADRWNHYRKEDDGICDEVLPAVISRPSSQSSLNAAAGNCPSNDIGLQCYSDVSPMSPIEFAILDSQNWSDSPPDLGRHTGRRQVTATFGTLRAGFSRFSRFVLGNIKKSDVATKQKKVSSIQNFHERKGPWHLKRLSRILSPARHASQYVNRTSNVTCEEPDRRNTSVLGD